MLAQRPARLRIGFLTCLRYSVECRWWSLGDQPHASAWSNSPGRFDLQMLLSFETLSDRPLGR